MGILEAIFLVIYVSVTTSCNIYASRLKSLGRKKPSLIARYVPVIHLVTYLSLMNKVSKIDEAKIESLKDNFKEVVTKFQKIVGDAKNE